MAVQKQSNTQGRQQKCYLTPQNKAKVLKYVDDKSDKALTEKRSINKTINTALRAFLKNQES